MRKGRAPIAAVILFGIAWTGIGLTCAAVLGLAGVATVFCDAPGMTPGDCLRAGAAAGFQLAAPVVLPVTLGALLLGGVIYAWPRKAQP
jgi:hypothetical protein